MNHCLEQHNNTNYLRYLYYFVIFCDNLASQGLYTSARVKTHSGVESQSIWGLIIMGFLWRLFYVARDYIFSIIKPSVPI